MGAHCKLNNLSMEAKRLADRSMIAWEDVTITLDVADPNYINTVGKGEGVTGELTTSDDGKTWTASKIEIPEYTF